MIKIFENPIECMEFYDFFEKNHKEALEYYRTCRYFSFFGILFSITNVWTTPLIGIFIPMFVSSLNSICIIEYEIKNYKKNKDKCQEYVDIIKRDRSEMASLIWKARRLKKIIKEGGFDSSSYKMQKVALENVLQIIEMSSPFIDKNRWPISVMLTPWELKRFNYLKKEETIR